MSRKANRIKVLGGLLVVAMAMFAVLAGTASATTWTTAASMTPGTEMEIGAQALTSSVLAGTVTGIPVELTAAKVEAVAGTKIKQTNSGASGIASATGALKYSEITLQKPEKGCTPPATITTRALKGELIAVSKEKLPSGEGLRLQPSSTTEPTLFATVTLGGECALAGTIIKVTTPTFFCGEVDALGSTMVEQQPIVSSATINKECGGKLEAGANPATLTGAATGFSKQTLGTVWGAE